MPHYKLVPSGRPDISVNEIILSRDESGEPQHTIHVFHGVELPEKLYTEAVNIAGKIGYKIVETDPPENNEEQDGESQDSGSDAAGQNTTSKVGENNSPQGQQTSVTSSST